MTHQDKPMTHQDKPMTHQLDTLSVIALATVTGGKHQGEAPADPTRPSIQPGDSQEKIQRERKTMMDSIGDLTPDQARTIIQRDYGDRALRPSYGRTR
jgi:hypothetical protein